MLSDNAPLTPDPAKPRIEDDLIKRVTRMLRITAAHDHPRWDVTAQQVIAEVQSADQLSENNMQAEHVGQPEQPFRVWWIPQIPGTSFYVYAHTREVARLIEDTLARYDLFQYDNKIKPDYANVGGVQQWDAVDNEWYDVDEDDE